MWQGDKCFWSTCIWPWASAREIHSPILKSENVFVDSHQWNHMEVILTEEMPPQSWETVEHTQRTTQVV